MIHLALRALEKNFGSVAAVSSVSLDVAQGELVCMLGPSGCGKTTMLNLVAGFMRLDAGEILLRGRPIHDLAPRRRNMGMVFQSYALFPHMTAEDNVAFGLEARGEPRQKRRDRARRMLDLVGLSGLEHRFPRELSGGQQQRVALARALLIEPDVLLLDEPFSNLDAKLRHQLRDEVRDIQKRLGITTLFVTHDQEEAMAMADRVAVVNAGCIEQIDRPWQLYKQPHSLFVATFLGEANVFRGTVASADSDSLVHVRVNDTVLDVQARIPTSTAGSSVSVCVRPERIRLFPEMQSQSLPRGAIKGIVASHSFLGARNRYVVATGLGKVIVTDYGGGPLFDHGASVLLNWSPADAWLFGGERGAGSNE